MANLLTTNPLVTSWKASFVTGSASALPSAVKPSLPLLGLTGFFAALVTISYGRPAIASSSCSAALDQLESHLVTSGETLDGIAATYQLQPATLANFNPNSRDGLAPGTVLSIPPLNGSVVDAIAGDSWQSLAERYGSRADILFEVNGCMSAVPSRVFIPSTNPSATVTPQVVTTQLLGYPLAQPANIALSYGWQPHSTKDELVFNNGIAFAIPAPIEVRTVDRGTVAFVGDREGYGQLLVINHAQGLQTRYANLSDISVTVGQAVESGVPVGTVGQDDPTYLYFEVRTNSASGWVAQDPARYLPTLELR